MALVMMWNTTSLSFLSVAVPVLILLTRKSEATYTGIGISFIAMGPLGWYIGKEFALAFARKSACQSQSFFGFGCTLNGEPFLTYLLFSFLAVGTAITVGFALAGAVVEKIGETRKAEQSGS